MPASATPFHVLIKPKGPVCNLDCAYCFYLEKERLYPGERDFEMADALLESLMRRYVEGQPAGTPEVNFAWQGGEPMLMGRPFFERAVALQKRFARAGMRITNALQTNGTLLDEDWCRFLADEGFLVGVSLDGPEPLHDAYRRDRAGGGSFSRVMGGIEALRRGGVEFNTLTAVHRLNGDHPEEVYDFLTSIGSTFLQLIPIVERDGEAGVTDRTVRPTQFGRFLSGVFDRWVERGDPGRVFVQYFEQMLSAVAGAGAPMCVHAETCGRALALEHDGALFSCDHYVDLEHRLGNVLDEDLVGLVDGERQERFGADKRDGLGGSCRRCEHLELCWGGCPKDRFAADPAGGVRSYLCEGYERFFRHTTPHFRDLLRSLREGRPAAELSSLPSPSSGAPGRNDSCPCGSGLKYKRCCLVAR